MLEARRHHADDRHTLPVEFELAPEDVCITTKTVSPETVAEYSDLIGPSLIFFGSEGTPQGWTNAQRRKEINRGGDALETLCGLPLFEEIGAYAGEGRHLV